MPRSGSHENNWFGASSYMAEVNYTIRQDNSVVRNERAFSWWWRSWWWCQSLCKV